MYECDIHSMGMVYDNIYIYIYIYMYANAQDNYQTHISYVQTAPNRWRLLIIDDKSVPQNIDECSHGC